MTKGGAAVVMVCRDLKKAEAARNSMREIGDTDIDIFIADFKELGQVRKTAEEIRDRYDKTDVLINNAGMHSTKLTRTAAGHETVFCVNHLASFLFTMLLLEKMKESAPSRIIQVNSEGHRFNGLDPDDFDWRKRHYTGLGGYGASKTAHLMTVWELAEILDDSGVVINAVDPGDEKSNIGANNGWIYRTFKKGVIEPMLKDVSVSGDAIYFHTSSPEMQDVNGKYFNLTIEEKPAKLPLDRAVGKIIWEKSLELTGLK